MKRFIAAAAIFVVIIGVAFVHTTKTIKLVNEIQEISDGVTKYYDDKNWDKVREGMDEIKQKWEKSHNWAYATLSTDQIDDIEISLEQSAAYGRVEAEEDFIGEFTMFCMLIDHLPKQEAFSFGELL